MNQKVIGLFAFGILLLAFALPSHSEVPKMPESYQIEGAVVFGPFSSKEAMAKGEAMAKDDFKKGVYRVLYYGIKAGSPKEEITLRTYRIFSVSIAGCLVSESVREGARGYNRTMQPLLQQKFGKKLFDYVEK